MSNLSDLLPAGGGAKVITATADGNLATGQTVALQSNGTVKGVVSNARSVSEAVGSAAVYESANAEINAIASNSTGDKLLIAYKDNGNSNYGTAVVATLSGSTLTYGTPVVFYSASAVDITIVYSSTADKFVISWNQSGGRSIVGTVSGTTVSFGSQNQWSSNNLDHTVSAYDSGNDKVVVAYQDGSQSDYGFSRVGTISGTSISFGSETQFSTSSHSAVFQLGITYDSTNSKIIIAYGTGSGGSGKGRASVGTVSGTSISFGSPTIYGDNEKTLVNRAVHDVGQNKIFVAYRESTSVYGIIGTVSGTSISFGTRVSLMTSASTDFASVAYHTAAQKVVYSGRKSNNQLTAIICTVSGTTFSKGSDIQLASQGDENDSAYNAAAEQVVVSFRDDGNSYYGTAITITPAYDATNSADFVGITNQAINNSASGEVVVEGGVITNGSLLPNQASATFGTDVAFQSGEVIYESICYDTANDKVVIAFMHSTSSDSYAQHGKVVVGTVSGTSISFGSVGTFNAATTARTSIAFDSNSNRVVIAFTDSGNSFYGTAIVGAVSGNSISFGSKVVFESSSMIWPSIAFDSTNNKVLIGYSGDNSTSGYAIVGTVDPSDNSISFGSRAFFDSSSSKYISVTFDSNAGKSLISYMDAGSSNTGQARVATISGTSVTYGTQVAINSEPINKISSDYDSTAQKIVVGYQDRNAGGSDTYYGYASVATISGTDVSFGTAVQFSGGAKAGAISVMYDPTTDATFIFYKDEGNSNYGTAKGGIISGTSLSFGPASVFLSANPGGTIASVKDPDQNKSVTAYIDYGNSQDGTAVVGTLSSGIPNFTIGSTYYVQDDGTLSTTSSSVTAGKAIANTTLLLKG